MEPGKPTVRLPEAAAATFDVADQISSLAPIERRKH
jgi:hypothetical protein